VNWDNKDIKAIAKGKVEDIGSYDDEQEESDELGSEGELNSDQKKKLKRDLAIMGYEDDDDFDEINEANARLIGGFDMAQRGNELLRQGLIGGVDLQ